MFKLSQKLVLITGLFILAFSCGRLHAQDNQGPDPDEDPCKKSQEKGESFIWSYSIGETSYKKPDPLKTARAGATKGYRLGKNPPTFDKSLSTSYLQNLTTNRNSLNLSIETLELNQAVLSAASLKINRESSSQVIEIGGAIRQVLTSTTITEILPQAIGFHVKVYDRNAKGALGIGGLYTISPTAVPIKEMIMRTPGGGPFVDTVESVIIDRENSGGVRVDVFRHTRNRITDTQKKSTFAGSLGTSGNIIVGELLETDEIFFSNRGVAAQTYTLVREIKRITTTPSGIQSGDLKLVSRRLEQYEDFSFGDPVKVDVNKPDVSVPISSKRLVREVDGYGTSEAKETKYTFYKTKDNEMIFGRLRSKTSSDGYWENYSYLDDKGTALHQQVKTSVWRDSTYDEVSGYNGEYKTETTSVFPEGYIKSTQYGSTLTEREDFSTHLESDGSRINTLTIKDGTNAVMSVRTWKLNPENAAEHLAGKIAWVENPDGTADTYEYIPSSDGGFQVVHRKGAGTRSGVTSGTETTTEYNKFAQAYAETEHDIDADLTLNFWIATSVDVIGRPTRIEFNGNSNDYEMFQYACCGLERKRNRDASVITWTRDPLKRVYLQSSYRYEADPSPLITSFTYDGLVTASSKGGILVKEQTQILNGDTVLVKTPDQNGDSIAEITTQITSYTTGSGKIIYLTHPDGGTEILSFFRDRQAKSIAGTAVADVSFSYGTHALGMWKQVVRLDSSGNTAEWKKSYFDAANRIIKIETPSTPANSYWQYYSASSSVAAGSRTQLLKYVDEDGVQTYYTYGPDGRLTSKGKEITNSKILYEIYSRQTINDSIAGVGEKITATLRSGTTGPGVIVGETFTSGDGLSSKSTSSGQTTTTIRTFATVAGNHSVTTIHADGTRTVETFQGNLLTKKEEQDTASANIIWTSYSYDAHRRIATITDSRTGITSIGGYTDGGNILSQTDSGGRLIAYSYDSMGRRISVDAPNTLDGTGNSISNITSRSWYPTGLEKARWGDNVYATYKSYDEQGRLSSLSTYRNLAHGMEPTSATVGADKTLWNYNSKGLLTSKRYADTTGPSYLYTAAGRLSLITTARGPTITHTYDKGYLVLKNYSDLTPDVTLSYDDYGQISSLNQFKQSLISYTYDSASFALKTETISYDINHDGTADFIRILDRSKDSIRRDTGWQLKSGTTVENEVGYGYDGSGRLSSLTKGTSSFGYEYVANSNLIAQINKPDGRKAINTWDTTRDHLLNIQNVQVSGGTTQHTNYSYTLDALGERVSGTEEAMVHSAVISRSWDYNARGELVFTGGGQTGSIRSYEYDSIGNRIRSADGATLPVAANYISNNSNQYEEVNGQAPIYDGDGNANEYPLPSTGSMATLEWDAENQLTFVTDNSNSVEHMYDALGRRIAKTVNGATTLYIYDDWNCIADYTYTGSSASLDRSYIWGIDLSGTLQGAGGVGGMLRMTIHGTSPAEYYPSYDGNGNICEYRSATSVTHFDYDSYGRVIANSGNPTLFDIRFSTKREDPEMGFYYFGYRYFDPFLGRWTSRDPIGERGGINLYGFAYNSPISNIDILGLDNYEVNVNKCEAYLLIAHGSATNPRKWNMNGACAIGGFVGCYPGGNQPKDPFGKNSGSNENNPTLRQRMHNNMGVPDSNVWPQVPTHNKELLDGSKGRDYADSMSNGTPEDEHNFRQAIKNALDGKPQAIKKLCDGCCDSVKVIIDIEDDGSVMDAINAVNKELGLSLHAGKNESDEPCKDD